jgi:hypothetical protein
MENTTLWSPTPTTPATAVVAPPATTSGTSRARSPRRR